MAATPEKRVKDKVVAILKQEGAYYFFPATHGFGRSGVPDVVCCVPGGAFLAIECKAGKNTTTPLQEKNLRQIEKSGGVALVFNDENVDVCETELSRLITQTGE